MSIFKCKMCGGTLEINANETTATCEYCGTEQTLPRLDNDKKANLYDRANHFRRNNDFDKAMSIYEQILNEDNTDAEAYWSIVLCRYGIEYVEDPSSHKRIPTVNRAQFTSIYADEDYKSAIQNASIEQKLIYEDEAKAIDEIQKGILAISQNEKPYDVFICYKETDENGKRTTDSVIANDICHQLTQEGFKVFYAAITLEDKLGQEYEPYIFAALNSAKVMLAIGSKPEYFSAVWVKNEWSRFMKLMKNDRSKLLIPCYKDMDAYELPEEFAHLQAQDMSKIGFINDIVRGIKKVVVKDEPKAVVTERVVEKVSETSSNTAPLLERAFMFLEDGDWQSADEYCEKVLDIDPKCAEAYLGKLMAELNVRKRYSLKNCAEPFDDRKNYEKAYKFGADELKEKLEADNRFIRERNETARKEAIYKTASEHSRSDEAETVWKAVIEFISVSGYKDSDELAEKCKQLYDNINAENERKRMEAEKAAKKKKKITAIMSSAAVLIVAFVIVLNTVIIPSIKYNNAVTGRFNKGDIIRFGQYDWRVLEKTENSALIITEDCIEYTAYNKENIPWEELIKQGYNDITWEDCTLRSYLNNEFYNKFSDAEKAMIKETKVTNSDNAKYGTKGGNDTTDKIFLLSIDEVNKYFSSDSERIANYHGSSRWWWLRSPGQHHHDAAFVYMDGSVILDGNGVNHHCGIRPALNLEF